MEKLLMIKAMRNANNTTKGGGKRKNRDTRRNNRRNSALQRLTANGKEHTNEAATLRRKLKQQSFRNWYDHQQ